MLPGINVNSDLTREADDRVKFGPHGVSRARGIDSKLRWMTVECRGPSFVGVNAVFTANLAASSTWWRRPIAPTREHNEHTYYSILREHLSEEEEGT